MRYMKCSLATVATFLLRSFATTTAKLWTTDNTRILAMEKNVLEVFLLKLCSLQQGLEVIFCESYSTLVFFMDIYKDSP